LPPFLASFQPRGVSLRRPARSAVHVRLGVLLCVGTSGACGGDPAAVEDPTVPASIAVTPADAELEAIEAEVTLAASVRNAAGQALSEPVVQWRSSDPAVASVDGSGVVTALANGAVLVSASVGALADTARVTVGQAPAAMTASPSEATLHAIGDTVLVAVSVTDANGYAVQDAAPSLTSTDSDVATVDSTGMVTATGNGVTTIVTAFGPVADTTTITVAQEIATVDLAVDTVRLDAIGAAVTLAVTVTDANGYPVAGADVDWSTTSAAVATVDSVGAAAAVANGQAYVVAASGQASDSTVVVVEQVPTDLFVDTPAGDLAPGLPVSVEVQVVDALGTRVASFGGDVTIALDPNGQAATLTGVTSVAAAAGVAALPGVSVLRAGAGFTLTATAGGLSGTSSPFDVRLRFASISAGTRNVCGLTFQGDAYCWGMNQTGGLGIGSAGGNVSRPTLVTGDHVFVQIDAGHSSNEGGQFDGFGCGITDLSETYCWGHNLYGQLGNGTSGNDFTTPVEVAGGLTFQSVVAARDHACGLTTTGAAYCWGRNGSGQLGNGVGQPDSDVPVPVSGGHVFASLSAGVFRTCGRDTVGDTYCWHSNTGLTASVLYEPAKIPGTVTLESVDPGTFLHLCGVTPTDAAYCWGRNPYGELGVADTLDRAEPTLVVGGHSWESVSASGRFSCGIRTDGVVLCWGRDGAGETAQGATGGGSSIGSSPQPIVGGLAFTQITGGADVVCGLVPNGEAYCWGHGSRGQRGDGTFGFTAATPIKVVLPG
jgi:alpha-tubulin suppressor-like RCC1 family protein